MSSDADPQHRESAPPVPADPRAAPSSSPYAQQNPLPTTGFQAPSNPPSQPGYTPPTGPPPSGYYAPLVQTTPGQPPMMYYHPYPDPQMQGVQNPNAPPFAPPNAPPFASPIPPQSYGFVPSPYPTGPPPQGYPAPGGFAMPQATMLPDTYLGVPSASLTSSTTYPNINYDVDRLSKALKDPMGSKDRDTVIEVLAPLSASQLSALKEQYKVAKKQDLETVILHKLEESKGKMFGFGGSQEYFLMGAYGLVAGPINFDAWLVRDAIKGLGTKEWVLTEVLLGRSPLEINHLKEAYKRMFSKDLTADVEGDLSGDSKHLFSLILTYPKLPRPDQYLMEDMRNLHWASQAAGGVVDTKVFYNILGQYSDDYLRRLAQQYEIQYHESLSMAIKRAIPPPSHFREAILYIVRGVQDKQLPGTVQRDAKLLESAMAGMGTNDQELVSRIVRNHWDSNRWAQIKAAYEGIYKKGLKVRVKGETSGSYRDLMFALIDT